MIYPSICLSIYLSNLSVYLSYLSIHLPINIQSIRLSILSVHPSPYRVEYKGEMHCIYILS
jgi:hypothetical protein